jgi:aminoglycoside 3-N-acetyltransferase
MRPQPNSLVDRALAVGRNLGLRGPARIRASVRRRLIQSILKSRYPTYGQAELQECLTELGINPGATIFVHSGWTEFFNFRGSPLDLLALLRAQVGESGTIAMPAFPQRIDPAVVFDARRTPTGAGIVAECFRRDKQVVRSVNLFHSVAAVGPNAGFLTSDHHESTTSWDSLSPFARLRDIDGLVVCLGLPASFGLGTVMHCPESLLLGELPYYDRVFGAPIGYAYRDLAGREGRASMRPRTGRWRVGRVMRHIDQRQIRVRYVSNLRVQVISARYVIDRMVELARRGIVNYYWPWPRRSLFVPSSDSSHG